jgi:hypothetical protein
MLRVMLNIPQPPTSFSIYSKTVGSTVAEVSESSMMVVLRLEDYFMF